MIQEDRELLAELKSTTTQVTEFILHILGTTPINPQIQRELAERLLTTGQLLLDHTNAGHIINGYVNGQVGRFTSRPSTSRTDEWHQTTAPGHAPWKHPEAEAEDEPTAKTNQFPIQLPGGDQRSEDPQSCGRQRPTRHRRN